MNPASGLHTGLLVGAKHIVVVCKWLIVKPDLGHFCRFLKAAVR
jgi:hypothetical protein